MNNAVLQCKDGLRHTPSIIQRYFLEARSFYNFCYSSNDIKVPQVIATTIAVLILAMSTILSLFGSHASSAAFILQVVFRSLLIACLIGVILVDFLNITYIKRLPLYYITIILTTIVTGVIFWSLLVSISRIFPTAGMFPSTAGFYVTFLILQVWMIPPHHVLTLSAIVWGIQASIGLVTVWHGLPVASYMFDMLLYTTAIIYANWAHFKLTVQVYHQYIASRTSTAMISDAKAQAVTITEHLRTLMPDAICAKLEAGDDRSLVKDHPRAAVLFVRVVFQPRPSAEETIDVLNEAFFMVEGAAEHHRLIRIKTIGAKILLFAPTAADSNLYSFLRAIFEATHRLSEPITLRAGVAIGPVTSGVLGRLRFQYDVWGTAVNLAARLEGLSGQGCAVIEEAAMKGQIQSEMGEFARRSDPINLDGPSVSTLGCVDIKGIGAMTPAVLTFDAPAPVDPNLPPITPPMETPRHRDETYGELLPDRPNGKSMVLYPTLSSANAYLAPRFEDVTSTDESAWGEQGTGSESDAEHSQSHSSNRSRASAPVPVSWSLKTAFPELSTTKFRPSFMRMGFKDGNVDKEYRQSIADRTTRMGLFPLVLGIFAGLVVDSMFVFFENLKYDTRIALFVIAIIAAANGTAILVAPMLFSHRPRVVWAASMVLTSLLGTKLIISTIALHILEGRVDVIAGYYFIQGSMVFVWTCSQFSLPTGNEPATIVICHLCYLAFAGAVFATSRGSVRPMGLLDQLGIGFMMLKNKPLRQIRLYKALREAAHFRAQSRTIADRKAAILALIYPETVCKAIRAHRYFAPEHYEGVAVLFMDVVGFTELSLSQTSNEIVAMLNWLYSLCDGLVEEMRSDHVTKVKTIGDAYIVACGAPDTHSAPVTPIVTLAHRVIGAIRKSTQFPSLRCRFGVGYGDAVGAVIGRRQTSIFDLFGAAVDSAEAMESSGRSGRVHLSPEAYHQWRAEGAVTGWVTEYRGGVLIGGKDR